MVLIHLILLLLAIVSHIYSSSVNIYRHELLFKWFRSVSFLGDHFRELNYVINGVTFEAILSSFEREERGKESTYQGADPSLRGTTVTLVLFLIRLKITSAWSFTDDCTQGSLSGFLMDFQRKIWSLNWEMKGGEISVLSYDWINDFLHVCVCACVSCLVVSDSATPQTVAHQSPLSMGFSKQEHWSRLPFPSRKGTIDLPVE